MIEEPDIFSRIINRGRQKGQNQFEKRRALFFNIMVLFIILSAAIMIFVAQRWDSKILNIVGLAVFLGLYFLHYYKQELSVLLLALFYQVFIFIHSSILDVGGQVENGVLAMGAILPVFFRFKWAAYFLISNIIIFYYPYVVLDAYDSFFKLAYVFAVALYFIIWVFVTENEKYEKKLVEKQKQLKEINKEKNHLIEVIAHDLKSPLSQIEGWINVIKLPDTRSVDVTTYLSKMLDSAQHMGSMITRILDVEKIEKRQSIVLVDLEINSILEKVIEKFASLALAKEIIIEAVIPQQKFLINGDSYYLEQIFDNLISNAIKFSPRDKKIFIKLEASSEDVTIFVTDEGPGITKEDQKKLYKKFQKLTARPTANEASTGLGLAITKSFVTALSGEIVYEDLPDRGATFKVIFARSEEPAETKPD